MRDQGRENTEDISKKLNVINATSRNVDDKWEDDPSIQMRDLFHKIN